MAVPRQFSHSSVSLLHWLYFQDQEQQDVKSDKKVLTRGKGLILS